MEQHNVFAKELGQVGVADGTDQHDVLAQLHRYVIKQVHISSCKCFGKRAWHSRLDALASGHRP
jgi:hypothetical protein